MGHRFLRLAFALFFLPGARQSTTSPSVIGQIADTNAANAPIIYAGNLVDNVLVVPPYGQDFGPYQVPPQNLGAFSLVIVPGATLAANSAALAAFNRAAAAWAARISDPITITINADLAPLAAGLLGSTSSVILQAGYDTIRNAVIADAANEASNGIMASTPTAAQFLATIPPGRSLGSNLIATKANLKALGFSGLDASFGVSDATITFSTAYSFDFDNRDGVNPDQIDFETVAAHEIGHALGFFSIVDTVNAGVSNVMPSILDLLRFANDVGGQDPANSSDFATFPRNLVPGTDAITDAIIDPEHRMSTGLNGSFAGTDNRQASHWKADELTGIFIGLMDPTLAAGVAYGPAESDFRALDLIGYDVVSLRKRRGQVTSQ